MSTEIEKQPVTKKLGGPRPGSGRKAGSTNKISGVSIIAAIEKYAGKSYEEQLAQNYAVCVASDDRAMIAKYDQMFLNKVVGDKTDLDLTSGGKSFSAAFAFMPTELPEWKRDSD